MAEVTAAIVGTGEDPDPERPWLAGIAYAHGAAYREATDVRLVACADVVRENAEAFAGTFDVEEDAIFEDYREMLETVEPGIVSVCVPPGLHADIVVGCARTGIPRAIHCEKPMADTWGAALRMATECWRRDVRLSINHQQRTGAPWRRAKELLDDGEIGDLRRIEASRVNLFDSGVHQIDLCNYFVDEARPEWALGAVDTRDAEVQYGVHQENQALGLWEYDDGVFGLVSTGDGSDAIGPVDAYHRLQGTDGTIEVGHPDAFLRIRRLDDADWRTVDVNGERLFGYEESLHPYGHVYFDRAVEEVAEALREGRESTLSARRALNATELIFGLYESVRRRGRVAFPLDVTDHPLEAMIETGESGSIG